jgi:hypothetical protein
MGWGCRPRPRRWRLSSPPRRRAAAAGPRRSRPSAPPRRRRPRSRCARTASRHAPQPCQAWAADPLALRQRLRRKAAPVGCSPAQPRPPSARLAPQASLTKLVRSAAVRLEAARPRSAAMTVGRLSFLASGVRRAAAAASGAAAGAVPAANGAPTAANGQPERPPTRERRASPHNDAAPGGESAPRVVLLSGDGGCRAMSGEAEAEAALAAAASLPEWVEEAARDMGNADLAAALASPGSGGLLSHVAGQLLIRPYGLHDVWLRKVRRGGRAGKGSRSRPTSAHSPGEEESLAKAGASRLLCPRTVPQRLTTLIRSRPLATSPAPGRVPGQARPLRPRRSAAAARRGARGAVRRARGPRRGAAGAQPRGAGRRKPLGRDGAGAGGRGRALWGGEKESCGRPGLR